MFNRSWLHNSSKATNWYNHRCYDNITLTTLEGSEISRSESIPFTQSKNIAWTRKLVLEIASKVHYLVLFFLHSISFFLHLNSFYLMPCNRLVIVEWILKLKVRKLKVKIKSQKVLGPNSYIFKSYKGKFGRGTFFNITNLSCDTLNMLV